MKEEHLFLPSTNRHICSDFVMNPTHIMFVIHKTRSVNMLPKPRTSKVWSREFTEKNF